jgi:cytochrome-b5 reductase
VLFKGPDELKDANGEPVMRSYTPTSSGDRPGELEFIIKRYEGGLMSHHLHGMRPGDEIEIKGPISAIPWKGACRRWRKWAGELTHMRQ